MYNYLLVLENTARTAMLRPWLVGLDSEDDMTVLVSHDVKDIQASGLVAVSR